MAIFNSYVSLPEGTKNENLWEFYGINMGFKQEKYL